MTTSNRRSVRAARRYLAPKGIDMTRLDDDGIINLALHHGWQAPAPAPVDEPRTAPPAGIMTNPMPTGAVPNDAATAAALAELIKTLTPAAPAAPAFDEARLIELIKEHANPVTTLKIEHVVHNTSVSIKGAHKALESTVKRLQAKLHIYLLGPAGSGKTTLAMQAATALDVPFHSTGAVIQKYELTGYNDAAGNYVTTAFYEAYKNGGVFLFDEIDASNPQAIIAFNQALANGVYTFPCGEVKMHADFYCIAAANTINGATANYKRNQLDGATVDRFTVTNVDYDLKLEKRLATDVFTAHGGTDTASLDLWLKMVQNSRKRAEKLNINVVISPRSSIDGAKLIAIGETAKDAFLAKFGALLSTDQIKQLEVHI